MRGNSLSLMQNRSSGISRASKVDVKKLEKQEAKLRVCCLHVPDHCNCVSDQPLLDRLRSKSGHDEIYTKALNF